MNLTYEMCGFFIDDTAFLESVAKGEDTGGALFPTLYGSNDKECVLRVKEASVFAKAIDQSHAMVGLTLFAKEREPGALSIILKSLQNCPSFNVLDIQIKDLSEEEQLSCAQFVESSQSLRTLYLSNVPFTTKGSEALFSASSGSNSLEKLSLSSCNLSKVHAPFIADFLERNKSVNELSLHDNALCHTALPPMLKGLKKNVTMALKVLNLGCNDIGRIGMAHLATFLSKPFSKGCSLTSLNISSCQLTNAGPEIGALLAGNNGIKKLDMSFNQLELKQLKPILDGLKQNDVIEEIDLSGQPLFGHQRLLSDPQVADLPQNIQTIFKQFDDKLDENRANNRSKGASFKSDL